MRLRRFPLKGIRGEGDYPSKLWVALVAFEMERIALPNPTGVRFRDTAI